jgi:MSHA pilin protein MshA
MSRSAQRGFTLIELMVVIVILGILAAFALPRFMGLETQARQASLHGIEGSLRSGAALARSVWLAQGTNPATITVGNQTIAITNGYPDQSQIDRTLAPGTIQPGVAGRYTFTAGVAPAASVFGVIGAKTPANCQVTYANATATTPPTVTVTNNGSGC